MLASKFLVNLNEEMFLEPAWTPQRGISEMLTLPCQIPSPFEVPGTQSLCPAQVPHYLPVWSLVSSP